MTISIRDGVDEDASEAIGVVRRSIAELCSADHHDDPRELTAWLRNKTEEAWRLWVARRDARVLVAEIDSEIIGVGMVDRRGKVLLNYVRPDARLRGVTKAMLASLEREARGMGAASCCLESTETAKRFYVARGYASVDGRPLGLEKRL